MKQVVIFITFFSVSVMGSGFDLNKSNSSGFSNIIRSHDFFVRRSPATSPRRLEAPHSQKLLPLTKSESSLDCRENIAKVICLVEPQMAERQMVERQMAERQMAEPQMAEPQMAKPQNVEASKEEGQDPLQRTCLPGSQSYATYFENLYDNYPPVLQRMFCSLKRIFVEKVFFGTAYAEILIDQKGNINGATIGIRQSALDQNLNLMTWASWKEQLSFGGVADSYSISPDLPQIDTISQTNANDFLYFVIAHEFGHIFDFTNELNKMVNCPEPSEKDEDPECEMAEGSWGSISWLTSHKPKLSNEFTNRSLLCFYQCNGRPQQRTDVPQVYRDLEKTEFISTYAATSPWEDFADSLAYFLMNQQLSTSYILDTRQGNNYDIMNKLKSTIFTTKYKYLEQFLSRTDIIYP